MKEFLLVGLDVLEVDILFLGWVDYDDITPNSYGYKMAIDMLLTGSPLI